MRRRETWVKETSVETAGRNHKQVNRICYSNVQSKDNTEEIDQRYQITRKQAQWKRQRTLLPSPAVITQ